MLNKSLKAKKKLVKKSLIILLVGTISILSISCSKESSKSTTETDNTPPNQTQVNDTNKTPQKPSKHANSNINLYNDFILNAYKDFKMPEKTINFLNQNPTLFPSKTDGDLQKLKNMIDYTIEYKHLDKSLDSYLDKVMNIYGIVQEVKEVSFNGQTITVMQVVTESKESYLAVYLGNITNLFRNCTVTVTALPVATIDKDPASIIVIVGYLENLGEGAPVDGVQ